MRDTRPSGSAGGDRASAAAQARNRRAAPFLKPRAIAIASVPPHPEACATAHWARELGGDPVVVTFGEHAAAGEHGDAVGKIGAPAKISADDRTDAILHSTSPVLPAAEADPAVSCGGGEVAELVGGGWRRWVQVVVEVAAANLKLI